MKKLLVILCAIIIMLGFTGTASATLYQDTYPGERLYMNMGSSVSWTFDITKDGFDPDTQDVTSASLSLGFSDDEDDCWFMKSEWVTLDVGTKRFFWEVDTGEVEYSITSLITLSDTDALFAEGTPVAAPVPEPATMLLFGVGLIGLSVVGRKNFFLKK